MILLARKPRFSSKSSGFLKASFVSRYSCGGFSEHLRLPSPCKRVLSPPPRMNLATKSVARRVASPRGTRSLRKSLVLIAGTKSKPENYGRKRFLSPLLYVNPFETRARMLAQGQDMCRADFHLTHPQPLWFSWEELHQLLLCRVF